MNQSTEIKITIAVGEAVKTEEICMPALTNCDDSLRSLNLKNTPETLHARLEKATEHKVQDKIASTPVSAKIAAPAKMQSHSFGPNITFIDCDKDTADRIMNKVLSQLK